MLDGNTEENDDVEEADCQGELHGGCDDELNELAGVPFEDEHGDDKDQSEEAAEYGTKNEESNVPFNCEEMFKDCEYEILQLQRNKNANLSSMYDSFILYLNITKTKCSVWIIEA